VAQKHVLDDQVGAGAERGAERGNEETDELKHGRP
jgi:hypothetical protein